MSSTAGDWYCAQHGWGPCYCPSLPINDVPMQPVYGGIKVYPSPQPTKVPHGSGVLWS